MEGAITEMPHDAPRRPWRQSVSRNSLRPNPFICLIPALQPVPITRENHDIDKKPSIVKLPGDFVFPFDRVVAVQQFPLGGSRAPFRGRAVWVDKDIAVAVPPPLPGNRISFGLGFRRRDPARRAKTARHCQQNH